jgi:O-antigen/teichoic acid export membrane protein
MVGTLQLLAVQAVALLLGFGISIVLTRSLGPDRYGLYSVAVTIVIWVELSVTNMFYQPAVKFLAEADSWKEVASALVQAQFAISLVAALLLAALATPLSVWLGSPPLASYLRVLAISIPISSLTRGHESALIGRGAFGRSTLPALFYWPARLLLVLALLRMGLSVWAGILALIGAAAVELFVCRLLVRPPLFRRSSFPIRTLLSYSTPLFLNSMALRLLTRMDLLLVQARAGNTAAGWYSAAQNLSLIPLGFLGTALSSPLLSTLSRLKGQQDQVARAIITRTLRLLLCLLPFAALVAGTGAQIVQFMHGPAYLPTARMLTWLIFGALALAVVAVCISLLTAGGRPGWTLLLTAPLLPATVLADWLVIPRLGAVSAAAITSVAGVVGALACVAAVTRLWHVRVPLSTAARSTLIALASYVLGRLWPVTGLALLLKLALLAVAIVLAFVALGELSPQELSQLRTLASRETITGLLLRGTSQQTADQKASHQEK